MAPGLDSAEVEQFINSGFVRIATPATALMFHIVS